MREESEVNSMADKEILALSMSKENHIENRMN